LRFLYAVKGCSHCDSRQECPKQLKNSKANLAEKPRTIDEGGNKRWVTYCSDFYRTPV